MTRVLALLVFYHRVHAKLVSHLVSASGCKVKSSGVVGLCTSFHSIHIPISYRSILPVFVLAGGALLLLAVSSVLPKRSRPGLYPALGALVGVAAFGTSIWQWIDVNDHGPSLTIGQQVIYDHFSVFFAMLISISTVLGALFADDYLRTERLDGVEAYVLMLLCGSGAMLMAYSAGLIMLFLGLEIMSIALYVLAAYHRRRAQSGEAGFKYFILGSFSAALFLYGVALIYGATGTTQFLEMHKFLATNVLQNNGVLLGGMALVIVGLGFKVAAVPFHFWTPDVYQGSPTPFTGFMAAVAKAAGFAGLFRVLLVGLGSQEINWRPIVWVLAVLTLLVGSVLAIAQRDLKRMFAYSSISQAGYVLIGLQAGSGQGVAAALFYLFTYVFIITGSFAVVALVQGRGEARTDLGAIRGLAREKPLVGFAMLVFLLAQAGIPLTSGFLAKFYVIEAAIDQGQYPLAIIGMVAAAVAAFFYLRVLVLMYSVPGDQAADVGGDGLAADEADRSIMAGLAPMASLDSGDGAAAGSGQSVGERNGSVALLDPPETKSRVSVAVGFGLAVCVLFTIAAGVSGPMVDLARHALMLG